MGTEPVMVDTVTTNKSDYMKFLKNIIAFSCVAAVSVLLAASCDVKIVDADYPSQNISSGCRAE